MKACGMTDFGDHSPRRYFVDNGGRRVLIGLTLEETFEFETLDVAWDEKGGPATTREKRWLELYTKHDTSWRLWLAKTHADRRRDSGFINQDRVT